MIYAPVRQLTAQFTRLSVCNALTPIATPSFFLNTRSIATVSPLLKEATKKKTVTKKTKTSSKAKAKPAAPKKKTKSEKELAKPKRAPNAFFLYVKDRFANRTKTEGEKINVTTYTKEFAEDWKYETYSVKEKFESLAKQGQEQHDKDMTAWREKYPPKAPNAYNKFVKQFLAQHTPAEDEPKTAAFKHVATAWKALTQEEKDAWKTK